MLLGLGENLVNHPNPDLDRPETLFFQGLTITSNGSRAAGCTHKLVIVHQSIIISFPSPGPLVGNMRTGRLPRPDPRQYHRITTYFGFGITVADFGTAVTVWCMELVVPGCGGGPRCGGGTTTGRLERNCIGTTGGCCWDDDDDDNEIICGFGNNATDLLFDCVAASANFIKSSITC